MISVDPELIPSRKGVMFCIGSELVPLRKGVTFCIGPDLVPSKKKGNDLYRFTVATLEKRG